MSRDAIERYENHAQSFLATRDRSHIGRCVVQRWAQSLKSQAQVLELGCGGGYPVSRSLLDAGLALWVVDSSSTLLGAFRSRFPHVPAQCAAVQDFNFFCREFDAAIAIGLLFLLSETDQIELLRKVSEVLLPGASFLFTAPLEVGAWTDTNTGTACLSLGRERYEREMRRVGLDTLAYCEDSGRNNYYVAQKRLL